MARFCSNCGSEVGLDDNVCGNCGNVINNNASIPVNNSQPIQNNQTDGFAVTGFILSLVSILCCGGTSFLGLIFSIIGLVNCNKTGKGGKELAWIVRISSHRAVLSRSSDGTNGAGSI